MSSWFCISSLHLDMYYFGYKLRIFSVFLNFSSNKPVFDFVEGGDATSRRAVRYVDPGHTLTVVRFVLQHHRRQR